MSMLEDFRGHRRKMGPRVNSKEAPLPFVHYTSEWFKTARTVYGTERLGLEYNYSDRLCESNIDAHRKAVEAANVSHAPKGSCLWWEEYLSSYWGHSTKIHHILAGFNLLSGYSYLVFGYTPTN